MFNSWCVNEYMNKKYREYIHLKHIRDSNKF